MSTLDGSITQSLFELYRAGRFEALAERARDLLPRAPGSTGVAQPPGSRPAWNSGSSTALSRATGRPWPSGPISRKRTTAWALPISAPAARGTRSAASPAAVDCDPRFAEPRFNLGIVHENRRRPGEAAEHYEQAVKLDPGYGKAWCALAKVLWELGDYGRVVENYERALAIDADYAPAHRGLMQFLEQSNRHDELHDALVHARQALGAEHPLVRFQEGVIADIDGDSAEARALLENCPIEPADPLTMHDERMRLARLTAICDRLDDVGATMGYAAGANRLSRQSSAGKGVDKTRFLEFIENRKRYFTVPNIEKWFPRKDDPAVLRHGARDAGTGPQGKPGATRQPVFIIGFPRSGTTLIDTILRGHPNIKVAEESDGGPNIGQPAIRRVRRTTGFPGRPFRRGNRALENRLL